MTKRDGFKVNWLVLLALVGRGWAECGNNLSGSAGTVLFHSCKSCWQYEDTVLLSMRKLMQNLVPTHLLNLENDAYLTALIDYFQISFQVVEEMSTGRPRDMLLLALCDAIGGYLHYYVLPVTRQAFYAGNVRYANAERIFTLYERIVAQLDTTARGWSSPVDTSVFCVKVYPLQVNPPQKCEEPCKDLITSDRLSGSHFDCSKEGMIPMPYLDNDDTPTAVAVPFRTCTLRKLSSSSSAFLLEKFYSQSTRCMISKSATKEQILAFNERFCTWLTTAVLPHVKDECWYAAFGGIFKVIETMKGYGICKNAYNYTAKTSGHKQHHQEPFVEVETQAQVNRIQQLEQAEEEKAGALTWFLLIALGLGIILASICCGIIYLCVRGSSRRRQGSCRMDVNKTQDDSFQFINTFVQVFYDIKDRLSSGNKSSVPESSDVTSTDASSSSSCTYMEEGEKTPKNTASKPPSANKNNNSTPLSQTKPGETKSQQPETDDEFDNVSLGYTSESGSYTDDGLELTAVQSK